MFESRQGPRVSDSSGITGAITDHIDVWGRSERLLFASLKTGDVDLANKCLESLTERFGPENERVVGLKGVFEEALAKNDSTLEQILQGYNETLSQRPANVVGRTNPTPAANDGADLSEIVAKRKAALLRALGRTSEAIQSLTEFLDFVPTDIEAWAELSELYSCVSMIPQAIFCLEEVLLITPNAWNVSCDICNP